jgi:hypothetical protein
MDFGIIASKMLRPDVEMIFGESKSGAAHWRPLLAPHPTTLSRFNVATQVRQKGQYWGSYSRGGCSRIFPERYYPRTSLTGLEHDGMEYAPPQPIVFTGWQLGGSQLRKGRADHSSGTRTQRHGLWALISAPSRNVYAGVNHQHPANDASKKQRRRPPNAQNFNLTSP